MKNLYASCTANRDAALKFVKEMRDVGKTEFHAFSVIKNGKTLVKCGLAPYDTGDCVQVYSLSKSFCSTAAGFAYDEGLWKPDDKFVDIFPEYAPKVISERLAKMTVGNILSMNTGHKGCTMNRCINAENPIAEFMNIDIPFEPGTHFAYNTGATFMIAAMVEKLTGESVYDYLCRKLFVHFGIYPEKWQRVPQFSVSKKVFGICEGGVGLYISVDCIEAFAQFLLDKGVVNGKRLISEEWIDMATRFVSDNSCNGTKDWKSGYGYQFWLNAEEGYRGDGAFGQLCIVLPKSHMTVVTICKTEDMQTEIDYLLAFAHGLDASSSDGEGLFTDPILDNAYAPLQLSCPSQKGCAFEGFDRLFTLSENNQNFTGLHFESSEKDITAVFTDGERRSAIKAGFGNFVDNTIFARDFKPTLSGLIPKRSEEVRLVACVKSISTDTLTLFVRFINSPHRGDIEFAMKEGNITVKLNYDCGGFDNASCLIEGHIV